MGTNTEHRHNRTSSQLKGNLMADVTIFGNGNMGTAIDSVLSAGGATVDPLAVTMRRVR